MGGHCSVALQEVNLVYTSTEYKNIYFHPSNPFPPPKWFQVGVTHTCNKKAEIDKNVEQKFLRKENLELEINCCIYILRADYMIRDQLSRVNNM